MARSEFTGRKSADTENNTDAYTISEFCARHRISSQLFYKLKPKGEMPRTFRVGTRLLISKEAADAWRRAREKAATGHEG